MLTLRPYQEEAKAAVYDHLRNRDDNPAVVIPTAGGKTPVMASICKDAVGMRAVGEPGPRLFQRFTAAARDRHLRALVEEGPRDREPDSPGGPGHERDLVL